MKPKIRPPAFLHLALFWIVLGILLPVASGCRSVAQLGLDYTTTKIMDGSGSSATVDGQTITLSARLEARGERHGSGALVVGLKPGGAWPQGWRAIQFSFRPEGGPQPFSFIEIDDDGSLLRAIGPDVFQPRTEERQGAKYFHLQIKSVVDRPYEVLVSLRHADGRRAHLAMRSVGKDN